MRRVLVPALASGFSAAGLLQADHVVDRARTTIAPWQALDVAALDSHARSLRAEVTAELDEAGVPATARREEWFLGLVYPGQTFDTAIPLPDPMVTVTAEHVAAAVAEFHRRNEAARLIETRAQEPIVRAIRLVATGAVGVDLPPVAATSSPAGSPAATARRAWIEGAWHDTTIVDGATLAPGSEVVGPAIVTSPFTSIVIGTDDALAVTERGDALVTLG